LPDHLLWVEDPKTNERVRMIPGELRRRDVQVGRLAAVSPGALPRFLRRFEEVYRKVGRTESVIIYGSRTSSVSLDASVP
jgi:hypothetical protein